MKARVAAHREKRGLLATVIETKKRAVGVKFNRKNSETIRSIFMTDHVIKKENDVAHRLKANANNTNMEVTNKCLYLIQKSQISAII